MTSTAQQGTTGNSPNQSPSELYTPHLSFDVASIRQSNRAEYSEGLINPPHNSRFDATDLRISQVIGEAYAINYRYQIFGGSDWINLDRFDFRAKASSDIDYRLSELSDEQAKSEKRHMLQTLLADRLNMKMHWQPREESVYTISLGRTAPKLAAAGATKTSDTSPKGMVSDRSPSGIEIQARDVSLSELATLLSYYLHMQVTNATGLTGTYIFTLRYSDTLSSPQGADSVLWPPIEQAFQEELGLTFKPGKGKVNTIVIDSINRPSSN